MLRDESFLRHSQQFRGYNYNYGNDGYDQTSWHWNMSHQPNGETALMNGKKSHPKTKNAFNSSRSQSSTSSGFQSFFRWFRKDEKHHRVLSDIAYPRDITSSTDTLEFESKHRKYPRNSRRKPKTYDSNDTLSPSPSPPNRLSRAFSQSSSCDSVFSTASSFAFVPPVKYLSNRNQKQVRVAMIFFNTNVTISCRFSPPQRPSTDHTRKLTSEGFKHAIKRVKSTKGMKLL